MESSKPSSPELGKLSKNKALSVFIPWSNSVHKTPSIRSQSTVSSTANELPSPWSNMSFDQLSLYVRRASNSSLSLLNVASLHSNVMSTFSSKEDENKKKRLQDKIKNVGNKFHRILLLSLNDSSLGFYRIFDHIHRKVPKIVETRKRLESMDKRIDTANSDIEDVRKQVHEIERIETFCNIADMIKQSLEILDLKKSQQ